MFVVSRETRPSHARIVLMSTLVWSRFEAVERRMERGLTRLLASDRILICALKAYRSTIVWTPAPRRHAENALPYAAVKRWSPESTPSVARPCANSENDEMKSQAA